MTEKEFELYNTRAQRLWERTYEDIYTEYVSLEAEYARTEEPVPYDERLSLHYAPISEGTEWGHAWDSAWFHVKGRVPKSWDGKKIVLRVEVGGEALLFDKDGIPLFGFTNGSVFNEFTKQMYRITEPAKGGEEIDFWLEAAANHLFGVDREESPHPTRCPHPNGDYHPVVHYLRLALFNEDLWSLRFDLQVLRGMLKATDFSKYRARVIMTALNKCCAIYQNNPANAAAARVPLQTVLNFRALDSAPTTTAIGHSHLDLGWLWPVRESKRKIARTCANQLDLISRYPAYVFGLSQPQAYEWVKNLYPGLWKKVKKAIADGRIEPLGGMWVEADCNLISGESMVRQFLQGKNFYMDEFGFDVKNLWLPDVFGYSASMPQILRKSGCDYFVTQKISWSQFNKFPHHTFIWQGIDGTQIFTHFMPENTYNSFLAAEGLSFAQHNNSEAGVVDEFLTVFGIGDGGGGPSEEFVECGLREQNLEGLPKLKFGHVAEALQSMAQKEAELDVWNGELYLELHRGTLTSQAKTKRGNRKLEQMLATVEFVCASLPLDSYPQDELTRIWKLLLLNQFHDILPGSSIERVYSVTHREHAECLEECAAIISKAVASVGNGNGGSLTVVNTLPYNYTAPIKVPAGTNSLFADAEGVCMAAQRESDGGVWLLGTIPADSWSELVPLKNGNAIPCTVEDKGLVLENELVKYEFDYNGQLLSAFDKECGREFLAAPGNQLNIYNDWASNWDAWEIDKYYREELIGTLKAEDASIRREIGPVRSMLHIVFNVGDSRIEQTVVLARDSKRLDFICHADWHEAHKMLRVAFPLNVQTSEAAFDIQYGYVKRPTHDNTSWDFAKFETVGQRYADMTDCDGFGAALLNDCKYGYYAKKNILDLNLLRSSKFPDFGADMGEHDFTYSLLPHCRPLAESDVMHQAAMLNREPLVFAGGFDAAKVLVPCKVQSDHVRMDVLKKAEKSNDYVIRLVETAGRTSKAELVLNGDFDVVKTNLIEWTDEGRVDVLGGKASLCLKPFELLTLKLVRK